MLTNKPGLWYTLTMENKNAMEAIKMKAWDVKSYDERGKQIEFAQTHWTGDARDLEELLYILYEIEPKHSHWAEQLEATNFAAFTYHGYYDVGVYIDDNTNTIKVIDIA